MVRYEDMASNPVAEASRIFDFLKVPFDEATRDLIYDHTHFEGKNPPPDKNPKYFSTYRDSDFDPLEWKKSLPRDVSGKICIFKNKKKLNFGKMSGLLVSRAVRAIFKDKNYLK